MNMPALWLATATLMIAAGLLMTFLGIRSGVVGGRRERRDPHRALAILRGFRRTVIGLAVAGLGAGWQWGIDWLVVLSLAIGGQELLESSIMIAALRDGVAHAGSPNAAR
jgi:hypothetical protein